MGTFRVTVGVGDLEGRRWESVEAVVDTGATYTHVPGPVLRGLGITPHARALFRLADGREVEQEIGRARVRTEGEEEITLVVFGEPGAPALLGAYALEGLRLAPDPIARRLVPVRSLWLAVAPR